MAIIETYDELTLDSLTERVVSVLFKTFADINGEKTQIGSNKRIAFSNCAHDREIIIKKLPEAQVNAILSLWGPNPLFENPMVEENL